jgi:hypothetical protein
MLRLTPSIHRSLGLPLLRVPSGSHSKTFSGSPFPGILFTCPNHRSCFTSITSKMFFRTYMTSLMVTFRTFSYLDFLADLLQKTISVASNLFACCVFSVCVVIIIIFKSKYNNNNNKEQSYQWLKFGNIKGGTESVIMAAQNHSISTNYFKKKILKQEIESRCRLCK